MPDDKIRISTQLPSLELIQMNEVRDDEQYFELQNRNIEFWREYGNSIDDNIEAVTKRRSRQGNFRFGIYLNGSLIGMAGHELTSKPGEVETGIVMDKTYTGRGLATEAFKALSDYCAEQYQKVYAEVDPTNERSLKLCQRVGYVLQPGTVKRGWGTARVLIYRSSTGPN